MQAVTIIQTLSCEDPSSTIVGSATIPDVPTIRDILDAVEQIQSGKNADDFYTGADPYEGELVECVDGWLVLQSSEGDLFLTHAKRA